MTTMRVMTWDLALDEEGIERVKRVLHDLEIDAAFLQPELKGDPSLSTLAFQSEMNCDGPTGTWPVLATLYRAGVRQVDIDPHLPAVAKAFVFEMPGHPGRAITGVNVNFGPLKAEQRLEVAAFLGRRFTGVADTPWVLVAGNYASVPPQDLEPDWSGMSASAVERLALEDPTDVRTADRRVGEELARAGFVDAARMSSSVYPVATLAGSDGSYRAHQIWVSTPLVPAVTACWTVDLPAVREVGPTFPVVVELDLARLPD